MNPERLRQIEELYHLAGERRAGERERFLSEACPGDAELRREVLALLAQDSESGPMERPVLEVAANLLGDTAPGKWAAGSKVGPYEIVSRLGEGGMGEVFKARDTRLGREVAIKTAHEEFSGRFQREARAISALNHQNVCTLYDVGPNYLVMELVQGANLAGPVPVDIAINYARQIAAGLEAAHDKGIVHRDLKPANIKVTPEGVVKILDFGLAKSPEPSSPESPTMTKSGMILGTAAYMSPEQARGEAVDKRTDIWAFGVVLYELLTGKRLFGDGKSVSEVIAAVLTRDPDYKALPKDTPPRVRHLLEVCLRKDPKQRLRDIGDVRILLDEPESEAPAQPAPTRRRWRWAAGFGVLAILAVFAGYRWLAQRPSGPFQHIQITKLTDSGKATAAAISPDGKYVLHAVSDEGKSSLWLLHVATGSNVQIQPPAEGSFINLNFSRDGNSLYYVLARRNVLSVMYTMPVLGGKATVLASFPFIAYAALSPDEKWLAFPNWDGEDRSLFLKKLDGSGERRLATRKAPDFLYWPAWSPDGETIAYAVESQSGPSTSLGAIPVEGGTERRISHPLGVRVGSLRWMPDGNGLIATTNPQYPFYQLWYVAYPGGRARSITNDLNSYSSALLTGDGSALVAVQNETLSHLWVVPPGDTGSAREISTGRLDGLNFVNFAGNGNLYFEAPDSSGTTQVWGAGPDGTGRHQITRGQSLTGTPVPCGDGRHLLFTSYRAGAPHVFVSDLDGGNVRQVTKGGSEYVFSCSPDGTWMTYSSSAANSLGVWRIPIDGGTAVRMGEQRAYSEVNPDGQSILVTLPNDQVKILPAGGGPPLKSLDGIPRTAYFGVVRWSADGTALLYVKTIGGVSNIWQRPLNGGAPKQLTSFASQRITAFAVSRDGKRLALARGTTSSDVVLIRDLK